MTQAVFAEALRDYCQALDASVTSYGRTRAHNAKVGGFETSRHLHWLAADVVYDEQMPISTRNALAAQLGLTVLHEDDHDHLQPAPGATL